MCVKSSEQGRAQNESSGNGHDDDGDNDGDDNDNDDNNDVNFFALKSGNTSLCPCLSPTPWDT